MNQPVRHNRIRGRRAQAIRQAFLRSEPLCKQCLKHGRAVEAKEIDHVVPLHKGGTYERSNLQGLCRPCHKRKTDEDMGHKAKPAIGLDGWPVYEEQKR